MPIIKHSGILMYYAHVPKCAGTAVEDYLQARFGELAFLNRRYWKAPERHRWSKTSPQHIDCEALTHLFPAHFFDYSFAVVRHPFTRVMSAYTNFQLSGAIPWHTTATRFFKSLRQRLQEQPYCFDHHFCPMSRLVPNGAEHFKLENGLADLVTRLDEVTRSSSPQTLGASNVTAHKSQPSRPALPLLRTIMQALGPEEPDTCARLIAEIYAEDFLRFGYTDHPPHRS